MNILQNNYVYFWSTINRSNKVFHMNQTIDYISRVNNVKVLQNYFNYHGKKDLVFCCLPFYSNLLVLFKHSFVITYNYIDDFYIMYFYIKIAFAIAFIIIQKYIDIYLSFV